MLKGYYCDAMFDSLYAFHNTFCCLKLALYLFSEKQTLISNQYPDKNDYFFQSIAPLE